MKSVAASCAASILVFGLGVQGSSGDTVVVEPGQTLSLLAQKYLGNQSRWTELCEKNWETLNGNCDLLALGVAVEVPSAPGLGSATAASSVELFEIPPQGFEVARFGDEHIATTLANTPTQRIRYGFDPIESGLVNVVWEVQETPSASILGYSVTRDIIGTVMFSEGGLKMAGDISYATILAETEEMTTIEFAFDVKEDEGVVQLLFYPYGEGSIGDRGKVRYRVPVVTKAQN